MTAVELQEDRPEVRGDLKDRIHGVRLEVCKSRTEMGKIETRLVEKMGEMETRLVENTGKMETRLVEKMGEMETRTGQGLEHKVGDLETRLTDRIDGLEKSFRGWLVIGVSVIGAMIALLGVFG